MSILEIRTPPEPTKPDDLEESLRIALPETPVDRPKYHKTLQRHITRRGLMWLGQTCNLRCYFCYYLDRIEDEEHPEHRFMSLEKAKAICKTLVDVYGNNSIDVQGGEPTLWKPLPKLIRYCDGIGMKITVITNGIALGNKALTLRLRDAGVRDFILSVQGLGAVYDEIVGRKGMWQRQMRGLRNVQEAGIPFRINTVLSKPVLPQLKAISELAVRTGAQVMNFLAFNPFDDQYHPGKRNVRNVPRYSELEEYLCGALELLEANGVEANVRYLPYCMLPERHRKSIYNFQQLSYDLHENEFGGWTWTNEQSQRMAAGGLSPVIELGARPKLGPMRRPLRFLADKTFAGPALHRLRFLVERRWSAASNRLFPEDSIDRLYRNEGRQRARENCAYRFGEKCRECDLRRICDGFHGDYSEMFGTEEARPVRIGEVVDDPLYYTRQQEKVLFPSDAEWMNKAGE